MIESALVGIIQGLTEFLPVSSSAHLVFIQGILGWDQPDIFFDVMLHCATLCAVLIFFRKDIIELFKHPKLLVFIALGTVPAGAMGLLLKEYITALFASYIYPAVFLLVTGLILFYASRARQGNTSMQGFSFKNVMIVGIAQACALLPGISRSGITIAAGMLTGWKRTDAFRFSFLLSIPAIAGATLMGIFDTDLAVVDWPNVTAGSICAFISGLAALYILAGIMKKAKLQYFAYYCWAVGAGVLLIAVITKVL